MSGTFYLMRHGQTEANARGVRCGGDQNPPLTTQGVQQALQSALAIKEKGLEIGLILTSPLIRTRQTAQVVADTLGGMPIVEEAALVERHLGAWNGKTIEETESDLRAGVCPPGGESGPLFSRRVLEGLPGLEAVLDQRPLLVGSKGVSRVLIEALTGQTHVIFGNGQLASLTKSEEDDALWTLEML